MRKDSLVLYKTRPARVSRVGKKLQIELEGGESLMVRLKDVVLLHPGPLHSLDELQPRTGEVETARELLAGSTTSLAELAELAYGDHTPATAWAAWQLVEDGLFFRGTPQEVEACTAQEVVHLRTLLLPLFQLLVDERVDAAHEERRDRSHLARPCRTTRSRACCSPRCSPGTTRAR